MLLKVTLKLEGKSNFQKDWKILYIKIQGLIIIIIIIIIKSYISYLIIYYPYREYFFENTDIFLYMCMWTKNYETL